MSARSTGPCRRGSHERRAGAWVCLPAAIASLFLGLTNGPLSAAAQSSVHEQLQRAANQRYVVLRLFDGQTVAGAFTGFIGDWSDSLDASIRYEQWRTAHGQGAPRIGDTLSVVLTSGATSRPVFAGMGPDFLMLNTGNSAVLTPLNVAAISTLTSDRDTTTTSWPALRENLREAPLMAAVGLNQGTATVVVPRERILVARAEAEGARSSGSDKAVLVIVIGLVALAIACAVAANDASNDLNNSFSSCGKSGAISNSADARFGDANVTNGLGPWARGVTRRP